MRLFAAFLLALAITACATKKDELETAESQCIAHGITPDMPQFRKCVMNADLRNQQEMDDEMNAMAIQDDAMMMCCW